MAAAKRNQSGRTVAKPAGEAQAAGAGELLDMDQAVARLKTTRPTFYRLLRSGRVRGMKVGRQWRFYASDLDAFLKGEAPRVDLPADINPLLATLREKARGLGVGKLRREFADPAEEAVWLMILAGALMRGSDIHLDLHVPQGRLDAEGMLRVRVDGVLHVVADFDARLQPALVAVWKRLASCDVREKLRPQDGRIQPRIDELADTGGRLANRQLDLRVCFFPVCAGEVLTVRILDAAAARIELDRIPYAPKDRERILAALRRPWGLVVVTGPSGCGKTTLLYACLNQVAKAGVKTVSIEDPVEYLLPWTAQAATREHQGITFPYLLRAALRSDPDVLLVGEIRERETLMVAHQATLLGHLVMTTLHAEDAAGALRRMVDMGIDPFVVADAASLMVSQRLVRRLCPDCSREAEAPAELTGRLGEAARAGGADWDKLPRKFRAPVGCPKCHGTGYRGRTVIAETLAMSPELGAALRRGASVAELRQIAVGQGMTTMAADGLRRAAAGETSLDEVVRVVGLA